MGWGGVGEDSRKASSGQAASVSSVSSSVLRMGQGLGFERVKRRASSQGYFLWDWSSCRGSSSEYCGFRLLCVSAPFALGTQTFSL